jgi:hypothetical protein
VLGLQLLGLVDLGTDARDRLVEVGLALVHADDLGVVFGRAHEEGLDGDVVEEMIARHPRGSHDLVEVLDDQGVVRERSLPGHDEAKAHAQIGVRLLDLLDIGADALQRDRLLRLVHRLEGRVGAGVQGEAHPVRRPEQVGHLGDVAHSAAVRDDGHMDVALLEELHDVGESRIDRRLAAADQDHRAQALFIHPLHRPEEIVVAMPDPGVEDVHIDAVVAGIVA